MKKLIILTFALLATGLAFGQSQTVLEFEKDAKGVKLFMYQSVIRMLNKDRNPEFNKLIQDLDHIRFVMTDSVGQSSKNEFKRLDAGIRAEGFEEIMMFDNKEYKCRIFELSSAGEKSTWVAAMFMEGRAGVLEMKGTLDLKYLSALQSLNEEKLKTMLPLDRASWD